MIAGIGNDLVSIRRIERALAARPQRFAARVLSAAERARPRAQTAAFVAGRWAAKEALGKALGVGVCPPVGWQQVSVLTAANGAPYFAFSAAAGEFLASRQIRRCLLSLSHDGDYALATVIAEQ